jgi:hypothetical protein
MRVAPVKTAAECAGADPVVVKAGVFSRLELRALPPQISQVLAAGWAFATVNTSLLQADHGAGLTRGIIGLVNEGKPRALDDWGVLAAWSWGLSRALDYLETDSAVDARRGAGTLTLGKGGAARGGTRPTMGRRLAELFRGDGCIAREAQLGRDDR